MRPDEPRNRTRPRPAPARIPLTPPPALLALFCLLASCAGAPPRDRAGPTDAAVPSRPAAFAPAAEPALRDLYEKQEHMVPMRDGVRLFTALYVPRDRSKRYPFLMLRTPYGCRPYGPDAYRDRLGPDEEFARDGYIFVFQDVRGRYLSEGGFVNMRPHLESKLSPSDVDESTDTYDTIEWLLRNVPGHNGRVGMWGISYPGFYAAAGMIDAHPALAAVSPQAPIADWWFDDFHHHGALFLPHAFNFLASFGRPRPEPTTEDPPRFDHGTPDGYEFFLDLGPLSSVNDLHFHGEISFWNDIVAHPDYDEFWRKRNLLPHLNRVAPAVMTVGGWFDAEDLYGALQTYRAVEERNPGITNVLVMGPWPHGGWARGSGERLGNISFGAPTSDAFQSTRMKPFFAYHLKGEGELDLPEATVFETGANRWREFDRWPPAEAAPAGIYLHAGGGLSFSPPAAEGRDEYRSDPARPVPFTTDIARGMTRDYMTDDQRFAARRPDVLVYRTDPLQEDVTLAGPVVANLWVSTSGTDSDWIVKLIDVFPPDEKDHDGVRPGMHLGGYQMMVRSEVLRGRFRNGHDRPEPFVPDEPTPITLPLQDVCHTFGQGHRIMVQIQSTWFPLVDRNPQTFVENIYLARAEDFVAAVQRVYSSPQRPSALSVLRLASPAP